jgi:signal transduction histidine kinase/CHASE3 domain sensor protein/ActR/RegA family two-component response regulator
LPIDPQYNGSLTNPEQAWWSTERKVCATFAFGLACLAVVGTVSFMSVLHLNRDAAGVARTYEVMNRLDALLSSVTNAQIGGRRYVTLGGDEYLDRYRQAATTVHGTLQQLQRLTADDPVQQRRLATAADLANQRLADLATGIELRQTQGAAAAQHADPGRGRQLYDELRGTVDVMKETEAALLRERQMLTRQTSVATEATIIGGGLLGMAVAALALIAIRRDFTGRYRAEQSLRAANQKLELRVRQRTLELEHSNDSLRQGEQRLRAYVHATSDVIYRMSPDWSELFQLEGQEFLSDTRESSRDWLKTYIYPDDQAHVLDVIHKAIETKSTFELEHRVRRADGTAGWTFSRAIPLLAPSGAIIEWFGAASDVTDRKQAELKLQRQLARLRLLSQITRAIGERQDVQSIFGVVIAALEEHLPVDFCCIGVYEPARHQLTITTIGAHSAALATNLGMPEQARIEIGDNGLSRCVRGELVYEPDIREIQFAFPQRLSAGGLCSLVAAPLALESVVFGVLIAARVMSHGFSSSECEFLRQVSEHVALATHQAQLYQALQRAYDDLRQTQQAVMQQERLLALGKMASGIAHDINNAISPIGIYTEMLLEHASEISPQTRDRLEIIQRAIDDVSRTVARLREFYRAREPEQTLVPLDLNSLVQQVLDLTHARWSDMAQERGVVIELRKELAPQLPAVLGVESELRDALINLIFNAADAMPVGGTLLLRTGTTAPTGEPKAVRTVQVQVQDTGIGMDEETRRRCLEPFFTTKGERGTGLGLAMVYGTLQRLEAQIDIQSAIGQGTTVTLSFPIATAQAMSERTLETLAVVPSRRILLVDDDSLVLEALRVMLEADGHDVVCAKGGQAGMDAFLAARAGGDPYHIVITDLGMPYVDGRKVASAVKSAAPETLVLLLTGWGQRLMDDGDTPPCVDRILSKPPRIRELRQALAELLNKSAV